MDRARARAPLACESCDADGGSALTRCPTFYLSDDAAERRRRRGNIPSCHAARPVPRARWMDGWTEGQMDGRTEGQMERWMELFACLLYSPVSVVAALTAARAFAVFKNPHSISNHQTHNFRLYYSEIKAYFKKICYKMRISRPSLYYMHLSWRRVRCKV